MPYPRRLLWDILPRNTPNSQNLLLRCPPTDFSLGGYGILPYPRRLLWDILPRNTPNSQNLLLRCPPTDFSLGGYGILPYPRRLLWDILPRNTPNSQNLLLRCPPTDFTDLHRYLGCAVLPRNSQNPQNLAAWVWQECHTLLHLCASVLICGRLLSARRFRVFRAFCGNIFSPTDGTDEHRWLGCAVLPQNSQNTQNLAAWVWQGCHTLLICEHPCSSVEGSYLPEGSVCSVRSAGISSLPRMTRIDTDG